jgi:hypothetical protein
MTIVYIVFAILWLCVAAAYLGWLKMPEAPIDRYSRHL